MGMFTAFRVLGGFTGTSFMVSGQTVLADIFEPVCFVPLVFMVRLGPFVDNLQEVRGTAVGFFMLGSVTGPAIGICPFPYYSSQYKILFSRWTEC